MFVERAQGLAPPTQMSDALSRNVPKLEDKLEILWGNCNKHYPGKGFIQRKSLQPPAIKVRERNLSR